MNYQVVQFNEKTEDVVFHDEMTHPEAVALKDALELKESISPNGWVYYIERCEP